MSFIELVNYFMKNGTDATAKYLASTGLTEKQIEEKIDEITKSLWN